MHADTEVDLTILGQRLVGRPERLLDLNSRLDRIHHARELRQDTVPSRIGDPASMLADQPVHDLPVSREGPQRPDLVQLHQARVALHVRCKYRGEVPLNLRTCGSAAHAQSVPIPLMV